MAVKPNFPISSAGSTAGNSTPTIILLPYGRMLVVDRTMFSHLQADHTGIDFMELSANMIRAQRVQNGSTPSILDSETTSKGLSPSPTSLGLSPPAYEDIFGEKNADLPPSYSELSFMMRCFNETGKQEQRTRGEDSSFSEQNRANGEALRDMIIEEFNSINSDRSSADRCDTSSERMQADEVERREGASGELGDASVVNGDECTRNDDVKVEVDICSRVGESNS